MINTIKKKLQFIFKLIVYKVFSMWYGRIEGKLVNDNNNDLKILEVSLNNERNYNLYLASSCRLYTDRIHNSALIYKNRIIEGASFQFGYKKEFIFNQSIEENFVCKYGTPRILKKIKGRTVSLLTGGAGNENYFHWLFDVLPRLAILEKKFDINKIDFFLIPSIKKQFQQETLNILNISKIKLLSSEKYRHITSDEILVTDHPYVISNPTEDITNIPHWICNWLRKKFISNSAGKKYPKNIYISRKDAISKHKQIRKIINEENIIEFLEKNNFEEVALSQISFTDQVNLFNNADKIVGLHGAGFANLVFCREGTKVLEIKSNTAGEMYEKLALNNNLKYQSINLKPISNDNNNQQGSINVEIEELKEKLNNF